MIGIYIHIPFCAKKCPYCDFFSGSYTADLEKKFVRAVVRDIENFPTCETADTVYFGGGTPSLVKPESLAEIIKALSEKFTLVSPEITIEVNPSTVTAKKLEQYRSMGINRLSLGVQSANDNELDLLGRLHDFKKARQAVLTAKSCGFDNISCDIMTGLPGQTEESLLNSIDKITSLPVTHLSSYILKIEKGTAFDNDEFVRTLPDDDHSAALYLFMVKELEKRGFSQYEISNFSKPGFESRHNLKYWHCEEYAGFGASAHSYFGGRRSFIPADLDKYLQNAPVPIITDENPGQAEEQIMLGLRLTEGINVDRFPDVKDKLLKKTDLFERAGLMKRDGSRISLTPEGFLVSNSIIAELCFE